MRQRQKAEIAATMMQKGAGGGKAAGKAGQGQFSKCVRGMGGTGRHGARAVWLVGGRRGNWQAFWWQCCFQWKVCCPRSVDGMSMAALHMRSQPHAVRCATLCRDELKKLFTLCTSTRCETADTLKVRLPCMHGLSVGARSALLGGALWGRNWPTLLIGWETELALSSSRSCSYKAPCRPRAPVMFWLGLPRHAGDQER